MKYEIIATLGPSSDTEPTWSAMRSAGATAFRLNTSHLSIEQLHSWLDRLTPFLSRLDPPPALVLDLQGSKWRLGDFAPFELVNGHKVEFIFAPTTDQANWLPVPHQDFFRAAPISNGEIVLNDAKIRLQIETAGAERVSARVLLGGPITPHKGITFTATEYRSESLSEKDRAILQNTQTVSFIRYAISYIKDADEMARYRKLVKPSTTLIAKIERRSAVDEAAQIAALADELWLCRGDLGAEVGLPHMAESVSRFSEQVPGFRVPAIMAGQVLEHMTAHATPTRSEVCYLYDSLARGYRGFVLSDEAAIGQYPVGSIRAAAMFQDE